MAYSQKPEDVENEDETPTNTETVDENPTVNAEKTSEENSVMQKVDAKMVRSDKNLMGSAVLRQYIEKKFEFEEVEGKV